jgi:hypothetical protein
MFQAFESDGEQSVNIESICRDANREPSQHMDRARIKKARHQPGFSERSNAP